MVWHYPRRAPKTGPDRLGITARYLGSSNYRAGDKGVGYWHERLIENHACSNLGWPLPTHVRPPYWRTLLARFIASRSSDTMSSMTEIPFLALSRPHECSKLSRRDKISKFLEMNQVFARLWSPVRWTLFCPCFRLAGCPRPPRLCYTRGT